MLIERTSGCAVDLENAPRTTLTFDQNIRCRDDLVIRVERWKRIAVVLRKVFEDHRFCR